MSGGRSLDTARARLRGCADSAALALALGRYTWRERDRHWPERIPHAALLAAALLALVVASPWRGPDELDQTAEATAPMLAEIAPAARGAMIDESSRPDPSTVAEQRLRLLERRLDSSESERQRLEGDFQRLQSDVAARKREFADRERHMADLVAGQSAALGRLVEQTSASVEALSKLIARTGIDPERLIAAVRRESGIGGPFLRLADAQGGGGDPGAVPLGGAILRLEALRRALSALPLEPPIGDFAVMSGFGLRRDPFNGQNAMHTGLDLSAPSRTTVTSTAPGTVVVAGWQGDYGNMVELDHGFGIRTRYAHLSRVDVRLGQAVGTRVQLGLLGSTGRSTGAHLHYEVLFEGDALDPLRFIEAKRFITRGTARRGGRG